MQRYLDTQCDRMLKVGQSRYYHNLLCILRRNCINQANFVVGQEITENNIIC